MITRLESDRFHRANTRFAPTGNGSRYAFSLRAHAGPFRAIKATSREVLRITVPSKMGFTEYAILISFDHYRKYNDF